MAGRAPDWTKTGTVAGYAEYLRKNSDAICVIVIRPDNSVLSVDPLCQPKEAERLVNDYLPLLFERVEQARSEKKPAARLELEKLHE